MAKEFAVEEGGVEAGAVHLDKRLARAGTEVVDHARHPALAGAALAGEQDGGAVALGQEPHLVGQFDHLSRSAQGIEPAPGRHLMHHQRLVDALEAHLVGDALGGGGQVGHVHRLGEEILRTKLHGSHRRLEIALAGEQDDSGAALAHVLQDLHAIHAGQAEVEDHHFRPQAVEGGESRLAAQLARDFVAEALEVRADGAEDVNVVVNEEY